MNTSALVLALVIGVVAGLRAMIAPAALTWTVASGAGAAWYGFLGALWARALFTVLAAFELVTDQLPSTPSRTVPVQFGTRLVTGGLSGAVVASAGGAGAIAGAVAGVVGAVVGTLGGRAARARLAAVFGRDTPAALLEDAVAIALALFVGVSAS
jgi:uncharacterized membrane protein